MPRTTPTLDPRWSPSEIDFLLRHAGRKSGPQVLRAVARAAEPPMAIVKAARRTGAPRRDAEPKRS